MKEISIDKNAQGQRFDRFCRKYFKQYPEVKLGDIYHWIRKGDIKLNGKKSAENTILGLGDSVGLKLFVTKQLAKTKEEKIQNLTTTKIKQYIIFEDENWIVFDKPAGIPMHGGTKNTETLCMNNYLDRYCEKNLHPTFKPSFCYRLDKDTSGILIAAKNYLALQHLNAQIRKRNTHKEYLTIVDGYTPDEKIIDVPLEKSYDKKFGRGITQVAKHGQEAKTSFRTLQMLDHPVLGEISLLQVKIFTGRMHQIRVHLAYIGFPVLGDIVYGNPVVNRKLYKDLKINRQILHCNRYSFVDMEGKEKTFKTNIPFDINKIIDNI